MLLKPANNPSNSGSDATDSINPQPNSADTSTANQSKPTADSSVQPNNISSPPSIEGKEPASQSSVERKEELTIEKEVARQINEHRKKRGLTPLKIDPAVSDLAKNHSEEMATGDIPLGHQGFKARVEMLREKITLKNAAENVAFNQGYKDSGARAVEEWLQSPGHKKNIEGNYNLTGIGVAKDKQGRVFLTQIFLSGSKSRQRESINNVSNTMESAGTEISKENNEPSSDEGKTELDNSNLSVQN